MLVLACDERVSNAEGGEAREVAIGGPELLDTVLKADRGDARVVHHRADGLTPAQEVGEDRPVLLGLPEKLKR